MPRIRDSSSSPLDFCKTCFPQTEDEAYELYGDPADHGEGPDGRGNCFCYDDHHPAYEYEDDRCYSCNKRLDEEDNAPRDYR